jgi:hypothetical protein
VAPRNRGVRLFWKNQKDAQGQDLSVPAIKGMEMSNYYKTGFNDRC